jgi:hypothetical protein
MLPSHLKYLAANPTLLTLVADRPMCNLCRAERSQNVRAAMGAPGAWVIEPRLHPLHGQAQGFEDQVRIYLNNVDRVLGNRDPDPIIAVDVTV